MKGGSHQELTVNEWKKYLRHHAGGARGKTQGADYGDEKGDCGN